jgi:hypothetical protein
VIRLTWRQFRTQPAVAAAALVIIAVILAVTGPHLAGLYHTHVAPACHNQPPPPTPPQQAPSGCAQIADWLQGQDRILQDWLAAIVLVTPALIGLFWGAPLIARELETGTFRLAWTQSVTRTRWLAARLGLAGLCAVAAGGLLSLMVTWWSSSLDQTYLSRFITFAGQGIVPIGYAAFSFALGVTAGMLIRRTVPAMAVTLVGYAGARAAVTELRPHFLRPVTVAEKLPGILRPLMAAVNLPSYTRDSAAARLLDVLGFLGPGNWSQYWSGNWVLASTTVTTAGQPLDYARLGCTAAQRVASGRTQPAASPPNPAKSAQACAAHIQPYLAQLREVLTYQPASRYWPFQAIETAIFLTLALALAGLCFWWIRRRIS